MSHFYQFNNFNADHARASLGGQYINQTGKYTGQFKQAVCFEMPSGAKGVEFEFVSDSGEQCNFNIFTTKKDGGDSFGVNQINAIMACMRARGAVVTSRKASVWDNNERKRVEKLMPQLAGLLDKPIGLLLEKEEYLNGNGEPRIRMNFRHPFEAATELMADEILDKQTEPKRLPIEVAKLKDQTAKPRDNASPFGSKQDERNPPPADFDDDIPF